MKTLVERINREGKYSRSLKPGMESKKKTRRRSRLVNQRGTSAGSKD